MSELTFEQKVILDLYKRFFGCQYPTEGSFDDKTQVHVNAQKMCYLLKMDGIDIGDFGYSWNFHGPFSPGLLAVLRSLDLQDEQVRTYYDSEIVQSESLSDVDQEKITTLIAKLRLSEHVENRGDWMELLGSLTFLSHSELPGESFDRIKNELRLRKDKFDDDSENSNAWNVLREANLLKVFY